jgi:hypothetical protein
MRIDRRVGTTIAAVSAVGASFAAGVTLATSDDPATGPPRILAAPPHQPISLVNGDLSVPTSCDELLDWYVERGVERVGPYGWESPIVAYTEGDTDAGQPMPAQSEAQGSATTTAPTEATSSETGTNVQEAGVDEPDTVKTDGRLLVRVDGDDLTTYDVTGERPVQLDSLDLPDVDGAEVLLVDDRVVVLGRQGAGTFDQARTRLLVVDVADPAEPTVVHTATYDTDLVTARQHGDAVRLVLDVGLPDLDFVEPRHWRSYAWRSEESALEHNRDVVRDSRIEDWLPTVTVDGERQALLGCDQVALPDDDSGLGTVAVAGLDPAVPDTWSATGVAAASRIAYFSQDRMYLATSPGYELLGCCWDGEGLPVPAEIDGTSRLYAFGLAGTSAAYVASGEVDGGIADRWSMDEHDGVLRVAVGPTARTGNFNSVVTFEEVGDDLVELGRVDKLGVNETIRSMRWFDGLAIMVTFRQVDPLYTIDLTDPSSPRTLGRLKIPGYSEYLHPLGADRLIGVGQDAGRDGIARGAQTALFDVSDLAAPRRLDRIGYRRDNVAGAAHDPRQFTWLPDRRTALTVVSQGYDGRTGWLSVLQVGDGQLRNRMVEVEYGVEVDQVRTLPLPDGRVVLVTGDAVSFFDI